MVLAKILVGIYGYLVDEKDPDIDYCFQYLFSNLSLYHQIENMKTMKLKMNKFWKMLVVTLVITTSACGQQGGGKGGSQGGRQGGPPELPTSQEIETMVSDLSDDLILSEEQEVQVLELYTEHFEEVEEKTSSGRPDRDEMEAIKTSLENDVKALLRDDQEELYTTYLENNISKRKGKQRGN